MCKLYALQTELTRDEARQKLNEKIKIIRRTEDDGLGIVIQCENQIAVWQCGESIYDAAGHDVLSILDDYPRMTTIAIHGRTSTSKNTTVAHSHPRPTELGPLMHNGVVRPKSDAPFQMPDGTIEAWKEKYDLDTDYLAELANRGELEYADKYLEGYAAVIVVSKDGTMYVQNQGASLYMNVKHGEIEFGTTMELAPMGNRFEDMRAEAYGGSIWCKPIGTMSGRTVYHGKYSHLTSREPEQKKLPIQTGPIPLPSTGTATPTTQKPDSGTNLRSPEEQRLRNKKGRARQRKIFQSTKTSETFGPTNKDPKTFSNTVIKIGDRVVNLEEYIKKIHGLNDTEEKELLEVLREAQA